MSRRIAEQSWICDCCGMENDQRGCVKGEPTCDCYHFRLPNEQYSASPNFCKTCGRCQLHCPGSTFYEQPRTDRISRYLYAAGSPITKETKGHKFRAFGFCNCTAIADADLVHETEQGEPNDWDSNPGPVHILYHTVCGKWYLPSDDTPSSEALRAASQ